jgi:hypothetical protein
MREIQPRLTDNREERRSIMMLQRILHILLAVSFAALALIAPAQTTAPAKNDTMAPGSPAMNDPTHAMDSDLPHDMTGYKAARTACDKEPIAEREQCRTKLNTRYGAAAPKCQKLSGAALDDCLKGAVSGGK